MSDAPAATSKRRKAGVPEAVLRAMVSPLPWMVRLSLAAMTGRPLPLPSLVLFTAVKVKVLPATSVIVFDPPAALAAVMSLMRSVTVPAV